MAISKRVVPYSANIDDFIDVVFGMRWSCVRCGSCCGNIFSRTWIDAALSEYIGDPVDGYCKWYDRLEHKCTIYERRPNICRGYPFIIRKEGDHYKLQVHRLCKGLGQGEPVDIMEVAERLIRYCEEDLDLDFHIAWEEGNLKLYRIR